ncbi:hypothetical protein, partial [Streptomyces sp. NEAU-H33]
MIGRGWLTGAGSERASRAAATQARERFAQLATAAVTQYDGRRAEAEALYADAVAAADERRREA